MKHLFIINPTAHGGAFKSQEIIAEIEGFFVGNPGHEYHIHVTRWIRDAVGYIRKYARSASDMIRVYAVGGSGTVFEALNAIVGLPNVQLAVYPVGMDNGVARYVSGENLSYFRSLRNLVFSDAVAFDVLQFNYHFALGHVMVGYEAWMCHFAQKLLRDRILTFDLCYMLVGMFALLPYKRKAADLRVRLDGAPVEGPFISLMAANVATYGEKLCPAVHASPVNGYIDVYLIRDVPTGKLMRAIRDYIRGDCEKHPDIIEHRRCKKMEVDSATPFLVNGDGEPYSEKQLSVRVQPLACDFVVPQSIDIWSFPDVYKVEKGG